MHGKCILYFFIKRSLCQSMVNKTTPKFSSLHFQSSFATTTCYSGSAGGGGDSGAGVGVGPPEPAVGGAGGVTSLAGAGRGAPQLAEESTDNGPEKRGGL